MKRLIVVALLLTGCAKVKDPRTIHGIAPEIQPYVNLYLQAKCTYKHYCHMYYDIPIQFADFTNSANIGLCTWWDSGYRQITIDKTYWDNPYITEEIKISLIFHELGHCDLNRQHNSALRSDGQPVSLMYPYNVGYLPQDEDYYFDELFNRN
jgi:hypothetical protein